MELTDNEILAQYREVFSRYSKDGIIDMDQRLKHKFSFQAHRLENVLRIMKEFIPPNRQSVYYITFIKEGSGTKSIGLFNFPVAKNTLFVVPTRVIHSTQYKSDKNSGYLVNFNIDFFLNNAFPKKLISDKKIFKSSLKPYMVVSAKQRKKIETIFEAILSENSGTAQQKNEMIAIKILELLILCDRFFTEAQAFGKENIYHPVIEKFNELLEENFAKYRSVQFYANALHVHPTHFNFLMKCHVGLSAKKAIDNRILLEAKYLLTSSSYSVKEIANLLGFEDTNYFSVFFHKTSRFSPSEYRAKAIG